MKGNEMKLVAYMQGSLTYESGKLSVLHAISEMLDRK